MKKGGMLMIALFALAFWAPVAHAVDGEITYTGTNTNLIGDDVGAGPFNLGFTFDFYGTNYTQAYANINGTLNFSENYSRYSNVPLNTTKSSTNISDNSIYAFWDDLNTNSGRIIYYATVGEAPARKFVMQWTNIYFHGTQVQLGTFQVILNEGTNVVQIQYRDLLGGDRALGNSATIGIRKNNGTSSQYSHNAASLESGQAIRYTPNGSGGYVVNTDATYDLVYLAPPGAPTSPTLVNPPSGSAGVTLRPTFEWLPVDGATSYTVLVSTVSNFSSTVVNQAGVTGTSYTLASDLNPGTTYYWRVQSVNANGSSLSPTRSFTTGSANAAPGTPSDVSSSVLMDAAESYNLDGAELTATLSDPDDGEQVRYRLQIATDSGFSGLVIDYRSPFGPEGPVTYAYGEDEGTYLVGSSDTTLPVDSYYLRIRAEDDAAASSAWYAADGIAFSILEEPVDMDAPGISGISVDPEDTSATVYWSTDEAASSQVEYGPTSSYVASTTEADTSVRVLEHEMLLTGLRACVTYHFRVVSLDAAGNGVASEDGSFTTKGCTGEALVTAQNADTIDSADGGTVSLRDGNTGIVLSVPANFASSTLHFQIKKIDEGAVLASTDRPDGQAPVGTYTYALHAVTDTLEIVEQFDEPLTLTLAYADEDVEGMIESSLGIYRWTGSAWQALGSCSVDEDANEVTCDTDHFSTFGLFGIEDEEQEEEEEDEEDEEGEDGEEEENARSRSARSGGTRFGCKDKDASNYDYFTSHKQELCTYAAAPIAIAEATGSGSIPEALDAVVGATTNRDVSSEVRNLELGLEGTDVQQLQEILISQAAGSSALELARVGATGYFGTYTANALSEYQRARGIAPAAGYFGPVTRAQMKGAAMEGLWW